MPPSYHALAATLDEKSAAVLIASKASLGESFGASASSSTSRSPSGLWQTPSLAVPPPRARSRWRRAAGRWKSSRRLERARVALVHSLCYSGNVVALTLERETGV
jgi:hypothetical protein